MLPSRLYRTGHEAGILFASAILSRPASCRAVLAATWHATGPRVQVHAFHLSSIRNDPVHPASSSPLPPSPAAHDSLSSFLAHADRIGLSRASTTFVGTHYEYTCQTALRRLGFALTRTGGRADAGVDLLGTWLLPGIGAAGQPPDSSPVSLEDSSSPNSAETKSGDAQAPLSDEARPSTTSLRCIVQCKALARKLGPSVVRELEGAFAGAPNDWRHPATIGVICAGREATKGVRDAIRRSPRGLVWAYIEPGVQADGSPFVEDHKKDSETDTRAENSGSEAQTANLSRAGLIRQLVWNQRVAELGAEGLTASLRYTESAAELDRDVVLSWQGELWEPDEARVRDAEANLET